MSIKCSFRVIDLVRGERWPERDGRNLVEMMATFLILIGMQRS
jgi:hypothetical protein